MSIISLLDWLKGLNEPLTSISNDFLTDEDFSLELTSLLSSFCFGSLIEDLVHSRVAHVGRLFRVHESAKIVASWKDEEWWNERTCGTYSNSTANISATFSGRYLTDAFGSFFGKYFLNLIGNSWKTCFVHIPNTITRKTILFVQISQLLVKFINAFLVEAF